MATPFLPGIIILPARNDSGAAKRARDGDPLALSEEADTRGWSSSVPEHSLTLRRPRGPTSSSSTRGGGLDAAIATSGELGCRCEEAVTLDAVGTGRAAGKTVDVDPSCIAYFCNLDLASFPPPMAMALLPPSAFVTDNDGSITILKARNDECVADDTAGEHGCRLLEAARPDAVGSDPGLVEETETELIDPYLSYFCLTLL